LTENNQNQNNHLTYSVLQTDTKLKQILQIKERNKKIEKKITEYREKNKSSQMDDMVLKNRVNNIKENFLITNLKSMSGSKLHDRAILQTHEDVSIKDAGNSLSPRSYKNGGNIGIYNINRKVMKLPTLFV
jgi:Tfp pilus assembly protein PilN